MEDKELTDKLKDIAKRRVSPPCSLHRKETTEYSKGQINIGSSLTQEEIEFGKAMVAERAKLRRYPDFTDVLRIAKQLGYSKEKP